MKKFLLLFLIQISCAEAQTWAWAKSGDDIGAGDEGYSVCNDPSGNAFITGFFNGTKITFGTYTLSNVSGGSIYLTKYSPSGGVLWAKNSIGTGGYDTGWGVSADQSGNVFQTGTLNSSTVVFDTYTLTGGGMLDIFLNKYDSNGNILWAKRVGGTGMDEAYSVSTDILGNAYITGYCASPSVVFGTYTLTSIGVFLAKYDTNGNVLWAKNVSGGIANSVKAAQSGNVFVAGYFNNPTITFGTYTLTNSGSHDIFLAKYDSNGNVLWAKNFIGTNSDKAYCVSADASDNSLITGSFISPTINFGTYTLSNTGSSDMFICKLDPNGNVLWAKSGIGTGTDLGYSVSTYSADIFVSGSMGGASGGAPITLGTYSLVPPSGSTDPIFLAQYDVNGNVLYATALASGGDDQLGLSVDKFCNAYIAGDFYNVNPFIIGTNTLTLTGAENVFVAKFSFNCQPDNINVLGSKTNDMLIYPNPNSGSFNIQIENEIENGTLVLVNILGEKIHEQKIFQGLNNIMTNIYSSGLYNYMILQNKQPILVGKLTVNQN